MASNSKGGEEHSDSSNNNKEELPSSSVDDPELDSLLDSALADFEKPKENPSKSGGDAVSSSVDQSTDSGGAAPLNPEDGLPEDYDSIAEAMSKQFEETFSALLNDPNLKKQFEDLAGSAQEAAQDNNTAAFADTVAQAINSLNINADNIQQEGEAPMMPGQQEMLEQLMGGMMGAGGMMAEGGAGNQDGLDAMGGMFHSMVRHLLSKELLYEPLKEVSTKYDEYLQKEAEKLSAEDVTRYRSQQEVVNKVVAHLDGDSEQHSEEEKAQRFETLLDLLQKMHELGQPPTEVVGEGGNPMMPDLTGMFGMGQMPMPPMGGDGQDPSQCCLQ